jgi:hypothetical protein
MWWIPPPTYTPDLVCCKRCGEHVLEKDKDLMCYEEFLEKHACQESLHSK